VHNLPLCTFLPRMLCTGLQRAQETPRYRCSSSSLRSLQARWSFLGSRCNHLCLPQICTCLPRTLQSVCANQGKRQRLAQTYTHANAHVLYACIHTPTLAYTHTHTHTHMWLSKGATATQTNIHTRKCGCTVCKHSCTNTR
jgi:hypothetical protein